MRRYRQKIGQSAHASLMTLVLIVYAFSTILQSLAPRWMQKLSAEQPLDQVSLVAIFVQEDLYEDTDLSQEIQWYAQSYVQSRIHNSKALVIPVATQSMYARDVLRIIENLYAHGQEDVPSSLEGLVFIGEEIPLPVVNDNGVIYPTIYPYVDMIDQRYLWDISTQFFLPNTTHPDATMSQPELWHGMISLGEETQSYIEYFKKLRSYHEDPINYIGRAVRYDDFLAYKESINPDFLGYYINQFLFAEDINYKRRNPLLLDVFQGHYQEQVDALTQDPIASHSGSAYAASIGDFNETLLNQSQSVPASQAQDIPYKLLQSSIRNFMVPYRQLLGNTVLQTMRDNVLAPARWGIQDIDTHSDKVSLLDSLIVSGEDSNALLVDYNTVLQDRVVQELQENKYAMHIPLLVSYRNMRNQVVNEQNNLNCRKDRYYLDGEYENFYYGKNARDVQSVQDLSWYRGNFVNYDSRNDVVGHTIAHTGASVGSSYGVLDQQIAANRGYNTLLAQADINDAQQQQDNENQTDCSDTQNYVQAYRGGNSPLNLTGTASGLALAYSDSALAWNPSFDRTIGGSLYDIAGARKADHQAYTDWRGVQQHANIQRIKWQTNATRNLSLDPATALSVLTNITPPIPSERFLKACDTQARRQLDASEKDFFRIRSQTLEPGYEYTIQLMTGNKSDSETPQIVNVNQRAQICSTVNAFGLDIGGAYKEKNTYQYKLIDTLAIHDAPTPDQFNQSSQFTTLDAPITSDRYASFQAVDGEIAQLFFPNIYDVPVYKEENGVRRLMSQEEIVQSLQSYLRSQVASYNQRLRDALIARQSYYNQYPDAFDFLAQGSVFATPDRVYPLMDEDMLLEIITPQIQQEIARILYMHNSMRSSRAQTASVQNDITNIRENADINRKNMYIMQEYLRKQDTPPMFSLPGYRPQGYEFAYINSNGDDIIHQNEQVPQAVQSAAIQQQEFLREQSQQGQENIRESDRICDIPVSGMVPLIPSQGETSRLEALQCWIEQLQVGPENLEVTFKDAQGPVLVLDPFKNIINDFSRPILSGNHESIPTYQEHRLRIAQAQQENQEQLRIADSSTIQSLQGIQTHALVSLTSQMMVVDPNDPLYRPVAAQLQADRDIGTIQWELRSFGDNCLRIDGIDTCEQAFSMEVNPYIQEQSLPLELTDTTAGSVTVEHRLCLPGNQGSNHLSNQGNSDVCIKKHSLIRIAPGQIDNLSITVPQDTVMLGMAVPLQIQARDAWGNTIDQQMQRYRVSVSQGTINGQESIDFTDFGRYSWLYQSDDEDTPGQVQIRVSPVDDNAQDLEARADISLVQGNMTVETDLFSQGRIVYDLPNDPDAVWYDRGGQVRSLRKDSLPRITLRLRDNQGNPLDGIASIRVDKGLIAPGYVQDEYTRIRRGGQEVDMQYHSFVQRNTIAIENGQAELFLLPHMRAGTDTLRIRMPGISQDIPIQINPAEAYRVALETPTSTYDTNRTTQDITIRVTDRWNNPLQGQQVQVQAVGSLASILHQGQTYQQHTFDMQTAEAIINARTADRGGRGFLIARLTDQQDQVPGMMSVQVRDSFLPLEDVNVMYMALLGTDRAQTSVADTQSYFAQEMIRRSPKLLSMTTQYTDPDEFAPVLWSIDARGRTYLSENVSSLSLVSTEEGLSLQDPGDRYSLPLLNAFDIRFAEHNDREQAQMSQYDESIVLVRPLLSALQVQEDQLRIRDASVWDAPLVPSDISFVRSSKMHEDFPIRDMRWQGEVVAEVIVLSDDRSIEEMRTIARTQGDLDWQYSYRAGSTNTSPLLSLVDGSADFQIQGYTSGESSEDRKTNQGRRASYQAFTDFAQGAMVGKAARDFASPWMIQLGDPLVQRIDDNEAKNDTAYDAGPGERLYASAQDTIKTVVAGDINNDNQKDILVIHQNGRVVRNKNYGGNQPYTNLRDILTIAQPIQDAWLGDVDDNAYDDLVLHMQDNTIAVYKNTNGVFDVDPYPVCLENGGAPDSLDTVGQIFLEDMDQDGSMDIVYTTDTGQLRIAYGGEGSYVSTSSMFCDAQWRQRQENTNLLLRQYGVQIEDDLEVVDNSLFRWDGLDAESEQDLLTNTNDIQSYLPTPNSQGTMDFATFDPQAIIQESSENILQVSMSPLSDVPIYETSDYEPTDIRYQALNQQATGAPLQAYKSYIDQNGDMLLSGDLVTVRIHIRNTDSQMRQASYIESLEGPWIVDVDTQDNLVSFAPESLNDDILYRSLPGSDYLFYIDNIQLSPGEEKSFSYQVRYAGQSLVRVNIQESNGDEYPDIQVYPIDGCIQQRWDLINQNDATQLYRTYQEEQVNLGGSLDAYLEQQEQATTNHISSISNTVDEIVQEESIEQLSEITGLGSQRSLDNFLQQAITNNGEINLGNIDITAFDEQLDVINQAIDNGLEALCQGFSLEKQGCQGLPVPFNMAFLAPGDFNIFGCKPQVPRIPRVFPEDKGMPVFWFPGTLISPVGPVPFPRGPQMASPSDDFGYGFPTQGGVYPSQIRVYVAPTLTMQVGMAVCLGPQAGFSSLPAPIRDISGNCVVFTLPTSAACTDTAEEGIDESLYESMQGGQCEQPPIQPQQSGDMSSSPFSLQVAEENGLMRPPFANGTYAGIVSFHASPELRTQTTSLNEIALQVGESIPTQIQGGLLASKGVVKCLINSWMDQQIRYIANNLTTMTLGVYLPDLSQLGQGMSEISLNQVQERTQALDQIQDNIMENSSYTPGDVLGNAGAAAMQQTWLQKGFLRELSDDASNPFAAISDMFDAVPLVNINTQDVQLTVPMIYAEDLRAYTTYLKSYLARNSQTLMEWEGLIQGAVGVCGQELTVDQMKRQTNILQAQEDPVLTSQDIQSQVEKMRDTVVGKYQNIRSEIQTLNTCRTQLQNGAEPEQCPDATLDSLEKDIVQLDRYAQINNQCMSFLFGAQVDGQFVTNRLDTNLTSYISFQQNTKQIMRQVRYNLAMLEQYRNYPFELYELIHVRDRYMSELVATLESTIGSLMHWLEDNAQRFEKWTDAVIVMIGVIKSRQAVVDLSVNRSTQCATCTNDTYDSYACSLSLLCVDLPVLPIPPFKIPSIYMDLSHLDIGLDILLPEFSLVPTAVPLPELPDLPSPPQVQIDINLDTSLGGQWDVQAQLFAELLLRLNAGLDVGTLNIPSIPQLPAPPQLPPLPSFLPTLELDNLPTLPPAPLIPNISPDIEGVINITEKVGKIFCIIKGGIGMVAESAVKSRIEQMTQRTREVPLFDSFDITQFSRQSPLQGFDIQIDAYTNFRYNFTFVYDMIDSLAQVSNEAVNQKVVQPTQQSMQNFTEFLQEVAEPVQDAGSQNIEISYNQVEKQGRSALIDTMSDISTNISSNDPDYRPWASRLYPENKPADHVKENLVAQLRFWESSSRYTTAAEEVREKLARVHSWIQQDAQVDINMQGIQYVMQQARDDIHTQQTQVRSFAQDIKKNPDILVDMAKQSIQLTQDTQEETSYKAPLRLASEAMVDSIRQQPHPMKSYFALQERSAQGFVDALENNSAEQLRMTSQEHANVSKEAVYVRDSLAVLQDILDGEINQMEHVRDKLTRDTSPVVTSTSTTSVRDRIWSNAAQSRSCPTEQSYEDSASQTAYVPSYAHMYQQLSNQYAQLGTAASSSPGTSTQESLMRYIDYSQYLQGIYIPHQGRYINVVNSTYFSEGNQYIQTDLNNDQRDDIILRDESSVWLSYAGQQVEPQPTAHTSILYDVPVLRSANDIQRQFNDGYVSIQGDRFRIRSPHTVVKNFRVIGETPSTLSYAWDNHLWQNSDVDGYLLKLTLRADRAHTKDQTRLFLDAEQERTSYVLLTPNQKASETTRIIVPGEIQARPLSQLMTGVVVDAVSYAEDSETISYTLTQQPRHWYYTQIIPLQEQGSQDQSVLMQTAPWSQQEVGGPQRMRDLQPPVVQASLYRQETQERIDQGVSLQGYIQTRYRIDIQREDESEVVRNEVYDAQGSLLASSTGATSTITGLLYEDIQQQERTVRAQDGNGNQGQQDIELSINIPNLRITSIDQEGVNARTVMTELSQDIDQGNIRFERNRYGYWEEIQAQDSAGSSIQAFPISVGQYTVTGSVFYGENTIQLYNSNGQTIARIDPDTTRITVDPDYPELQTSVDLTGHYPQIHLTNTDEQRDLFSMYIAPDRLSRYAGIQLQRGTHSIISLDQEHYGEMQGGSCVVAGEGGDCEIIISPSGRIILPDPYHLSYTAEHRYNDDDTVTYMFTGPQGYRVVDVTIHPQGF